MFIYHVINPINQAKSWWIIYRFSWLDKKKATKNPINKKDNECFQYTVTALLNYKEIKKDPQRLTKLKPFIDKYNWKGINCPSEKGDWKKIGKSNVTIPFHVLYAQKEKNISCFMLQKITQTVKNKLFF